jgi:hypothetical protein
MQGMGLLRGGREEEMVIMLPMLVELMEDTQKELQSKHW